MRQFWNLMIASNRRGIVVIGQAFADASARTARGVVLLPWGADGGDLRRVRLVAIGGRAVGWGPRRFVASRASAGSM
jgi:hypothetical protein